MLIHFYSFQFILFYFVTDPSVPSKALKVGFVVFIMITETEKNIMTIKKVKTSPW